ncbi:hypothetical protein EHN06_15265 [Marinobacter sp. NP-4(2019)]|uniref:hypothetical protein n=1 Tax=Marinobacter sp. NP-4(2019) TaxID=2488665 RepID=UPI000FC3CDA7|nr:hypothetical protein [Marinobacter sp. NP-4(2019)]AZT84802.1 hypothetical protein EHN06_15265 [Marinobacter sp. NP-4(2019)]
MGEMDIRGNAYYKRLDKLLFWPVLGLVVLVLVVSVLLFVVFNQYYLPSISLSLEQAVSSDVLAFIRAGYQKIATTLFVWISVLLFLNFLLVYVVWNVKKFLADLSRNVDR